MYFPIIDVLKENFIAKIPSIVTQWLEDNVNPVGSAVVVDTSLSISGAAADAKITGDELNDLKSDFGYNNGVSVIMSDGGISSTDGSVIAQSADKEQHSQLIRVNNGDTLAVTIALTQNKYYFFAINAYDENQNFISRVFFEEGGLKQIYTNLYTVDDIKIRYLNFTIKTFDVLSSATANVYGNTSLIYDTPDFTMFDGKMLGDGRVLFEQTSNYEKFSSIIDVVYGETVSIDFSFTSAKYRFGAVFGYKADGTLVKRIALVEGGSVQTFNVTVTIDDINIKYIRFTTYGFNALINCTVKTWYPEYKTYALQKAVEERHRRTEAKKKEIKIISRQGEFYQGFMLYYYPNNNLIGIQNAYENGYEAIRITARITSDNVAVLCHDESINNVARNSDGTAISETVNVADHTLSELNQYDFGILYGAKFAGTKITQLTDALALCKKLGLYCTIELYADSLTSAQKSAVVTPIILTGMRKFCEIRCHVISVIQSLATDYSGLNYSLTCPAGMSEPDQLAIVDTAISLKTNTNIITITIGYAADGSTTVYQSVNNKCAVNGLPICLAGIYTDTALMEWAVSQYDAVEVATVNKPYVLLENML